MSDAEAYYIPRNLDEPEKWLFWSMDEAIMFLAPLILGICINEMAISLVTGLVLYLGLKRLKGTDQANLALYAFYWFFPSCITRLKTPPSYIRYYIG
jgi:conjugal transfer pilus assembly protein TraL